MKLNSIAPLLLVFAVSFALLLTSCQREPDIAQAPPSPNDSAYLVMTVFLDTTFPSGLDTTMKDIFTYDAQKRISTNDYWEYFAGDPTPHDGELTEWFYHGNDTLPYKIVREGSDTIFFTYENGIVVKDSICYVPNGLGYDKEIVTYQKPGPNRHLETHRFFNAGIQVASHIGSGITTLNGNGDIIFQKDTLTSASGVYQREWQVTYDDKPNPYQGMVVNYPTLSGSFGGLFYHHAHNNFTRGIFKFKILSTGTENVEDYTRHYRYRSDGYPVATWEEEPALGYHGKLVFIYGRL